jgi:triphosphatase
MHRTLRWLELGDWRDGRRAEQPLSLFAIKQLNRRWRKISMFSGNLSEVTPEQRHQLRIDIKKMRYSSEFLAVLIDGKETFEPHAGFVNLLEELQEHLGELNDEETGLELLARMPLSTEDERRFADTLRRRQKRPAKVLEAAGNAHSRLLAHGVFWRSQFDDPAIGKSRVK